MKLASLPLVVLLALVSWSSGQTTSGQWTYIVQNGAATITRSTATGAVTIPSVLGGFAVRKVGNGQWPPVFGYDNTSVTSVNLPDSVTSIGANAFADCAGLTSVSIPDNVTSIGGGAFGSCTGLTSVSIGDGVTSIGGGAFGGCTGLISISIGSASTTYSSIDGVLFSKTAATLVTYPIGKEGPYTIPTSVTHIGAEAFLGCTGLTGVSIPDSVTSIGDRAFSGCAGLTSVSISDGVTSIGNFAFRDCAGLTSVTIPDSVTSIGMYAFGRCTGLTSVSIGNGVTYIGVEAFRDCNALASVVIGSSVTEIQTSVFQGCTGLRQITLAEGLLAVGGGWFQSLPITSVIIPDSVTSIGGYAFANCSGLTSVTIPNRLTTIGEYAFIGCTGLTSVVVPNKMTSIGAYAFRECRSLASIFFNGNAPLLGTEALSTGSNTLVYYLAETIGWSSIFGGLTTVALGPPIISEQPFSVVANLGDAVEFSVLASSTVPLPLSYQWKKNGMVIEGAMMATLSVNSVQGIDAGIYSVVVTNRYGSVRSSSAGLALSQGNLYTQAQVDAAYRSGFGLGLEVGGNNSAVLENPNQHGLYSLSQVQAINVGTPLLTRDLTTGKCKLTVGVQKSSDLVNFIPMVIPEGSAVINSQGEIEFEFNSADSAAFFRVEAK